VIKNVGRRDGQRRGSASLAFAIHALDPDGLAIRSILPQCFGDTNQPDALVGIRAWTAELFDALDTQDALIESGVFGRLEVPVSIILVTRTAIRTRRMRPR
jgi:hypothetical protein